MHFGEAMGRSHIFDAKGSLCDVCQCRSYWGGAAFQPVERIGTIGSGADISHQLASIAGFLNANSNAQTAQGITNILKMTGHILVKNGIAQTAVDLGFVQAVAHLR
jgi:hypothetical protein